MNKVLVKSRLIALANDEMLNAMNGKFGSRREHVNGIAQSLL